jgi:hypothetical protein
MALLVGLPESTLMDESGDSIVDITPPWFSTLIYHFGDDGLGSETYLTPLDMIITFMFQL